MDINNIAPEHYQKEIDELNSELSTSESFCAELKDRNMELLSSILTLRARIKELEGKSNE